MPSDTIWITGLSGAGKTTLAEALVERMRRRGRPVVLVDGDVIRDLFGASLGFDVDARRVQIGRLQALARFLADQGVDVVVAALYSAPDLLAWNRANLAGYFEVYIEASLALVTGRNSKGLYDGTTRNVVGVDIDWLAPRSPDLVVEADREEPVAEVAVRIERHLADRAGSET